MSFLNLRAFITPRCPRHGCKHRTRKVQVDRGVYNFENYCPECEREKKQRQEEHNTRYKSFEKSAQCPHCGRTYDASFTKFCPSCGIDMKKVASEARRKNYVCNCGYLWTGGEQFCPKCGLKR